MYTEKAKKDACLSELIAQDIRGQVKRHQ